MTLEIVSKVGVRNSRRKDANKLGWIYQSTHTHTHTHTIIHYFPALASEATVLENRDKNKNKKQNKTKKTATPGQHML